MTMITSAQLRAARSLLGLSQPEVANAAGVSTMTLKRAEGSGDSPAAAKSVRVIQTALEAAGIEFVGQDGDRPGVRLRTTQATLGSPRPDESRVEAPR
jgi:transcriptional regulator with XRE-family HTH domain